MSNSDDGSLHALGDLLARWERAGLGPVLVGDQRGIDQAAAHLAPQCQVYRRTGDTPAALVARSARLVGE